MENGFELRVMFVNNIISHVFILYDLQLVAESLKAKQLQASLLAEKQVLASRVQHANTTADHHKQRVSQLEDKVRFLITVISCAGCICGEVDF